MHATQFRSSPYFNCVDERMQNNQMHKILIEVVQRTAPNKNRQRHSNRKSNGLSTSDPPNSQSRKSKYINIPPKKNLHQTTTDTTIKSNPLIFPSCLRLSALNFVTLSPRVSLQRGDRVGSSAGAAGEATKLKSWERAIDPYSRHQVGWWVTMYMRIIFDIHIYIYLKYDISYKLM